MPTVTVTCQVHDQGSNTRITPGGVDFTTGNYKDERTIDVGAAQETVTIAGDVTSNNGPGIAYFRNHHATQSVQIGKTTADYMIDLPAGAHQVMILDDAVTQLFMLASGASTPVEMRIYNRAS